METKIVYELTEKDLDKVLLMRLKKLKTDAVLGRFADRMVSADTVAEIHGVHRNTVIKYALAKLLPHVKNGKLYKFSLAAVLEFDFKELRRVC
jgi:hypothetical protein